MHNNLIIVVTATLIIGISSIVHSVPLNAASSDYQQIVHFHLFPQGRSIDKMMSQTSGYSLLSGAHTNVGNGATVTLNIVGNSAFGPPNSNAQGSQYMNPYGNGYPQQFGGYSGVNPYMRYGYGPNYGNGYVGYGTQPQFEGHGNYGGESSTNKHPLRDNNSSRRLGPTDPTSSNNVPELQLESSQTKELPRQEKQDTDRERDSIVSENEKAISA